MVCDSTNKNYTLYIDGVLVLSTTVTTTYNGTNCTVNKIGSAGISTMLLFDDFHVYASALQLSDITSLYNRYSNPGVFIPTLHYSFDQWTSGTTEINEGSYLNIDATLLVLCTGGTCSIVTSPDSPTGTNYLSLVPGTTWGGYRQLPTFTFGGGGLSVCFWYLLDLKKSMEQ